MCGAFAWRFRYIRRTMHTPNNKKINQTTEMCGGPVSNLSFVGDALSAWKLSRFDRLTLKSRNEGNHLESIPYLHDHIFVKYRIQNMSVWYALLC